jgi:hypothetical protein
VRYSNTHSLTLTLTPVVWPPRRLGGTRTWTRTRTRARPAAVFFAFFFFGRKAGRGSLLGLAVVLCFDFVFGPRLCVCQVGLGEEY